MTQRLESYYVPERITASNFELSSRGAGNRDLALKELRDYVKRYKSTFLGYQASQYLQNQHLGDFLDASINNIGDSFSTPGAELPDGYFTLNCKWVERAVLDYYAKLWHLNPPRYVQADERPGWEDSYWGYVLSMGCTEGNLMALRGARDYLLGRQLLFEEDRPRILEGLRYVEPDVPENMRGSDHKRPVLLYSTASHYSIKKLAQMLELEAELVETDAHGQIDLEDLEAKARKILDQKIPLAVSFNYGTTFTGGFDDVEEAIKVVMPHILRNGMHERRFTHRDRAGKEWTCTRKGYWFHVDGALGAGHVPYQRRDGDFTYPRFDFELDIQSLAMSGHKWPGAPWPTGIYMSRNRYLLTNDVPAYVGSLDSTLAGSRSGIAAIFLWDLIARTPDAVRTGQVQDQLANARYAMQELGKRNWNPQRAPGAIAVVFDKPTGRNAHAILRQFSMPVSGDQAHILCMPHVTQRSIDRLTAALGTRPVQAGVDRVAPAPADVRGGW